MIEQLRTVLLENTAIVTRIVETIFILIILMLARRMIMHTVNRRIDNADHVYAWRKGTEYMVIFVGLLVVVALWFEGFSDASTYLGLLSAGIAIALQDPLINFVGWIYIVARQPFEVGDRIQLGEIIGDVIDIQLLTFTVLEIGNWVDADQSTGRVLHVPNRQVFSQHTANYSSGIPYIWNELPITVTFESDWQRAKFMLEEIIERHSLRLSEKEIDDVRQTAKKNNVRFPRLTPAVYTKVADSGVVLTMRYLCEPRQRRDSEQLIWEEVLRLFAEEQELDFAYPTQRIFYHPIEGKTLLSDHSEVAEPRNHLVDPRANEGQ